MVTTMVTIFSFAPWSVLMEEACRVGKLKGPLETGAPTAIWKYLSPVGEAVSSQKYCHMALEEKT